MALEQGRAGYPLTTDRSDRIIRQEEHRRRALRKAYARLANLHPHEWTVLVSAAFQEEGLTVDGKLTT